MFMGNVGVLSLLAYLYGGTHAIIFIYLFFPAERAYTPVILDMLSVVSCSLRE